MNEITVGGNVALSHTGRLHTLVQMARESSLCFLLFGLACCGIEIMQRDSASVSLLTAAEVARRLSICRATVYRICRDGRLGPVRVSNAIRVPVNALGHHLNGSIHPQRRRP